MKDLMTQQHRSRKSEHLSLCRDQPVESNDVNTGLADYWFMHEALPEIDLEDANTRCGLFGRTLSSPFIISSMTGGCDEGEKINMVLAEAAQAVDVAMGVGSQRVGLMDDRLASTFKVRRVAPDIVLFANLGAIQLNNGFSIDECRAVVDMIEADALILHLNPLQESVQPGGNVNFSGLSNKIEQICENLEVPVIVKEVGQGISQRTARLLRDAGVAGIDTAGAGGTSWPRVESLRGCNGMSEVGETFANWGIPTAQSIILCRNEAPDLTIIASGGIRSGLDAAKSLALGADMAGFGLPLLKEAALGVGSVIKCLDKYRDELRIAMFCIGARDLTELKHTRALVYGRGIFQTHQD